VSAAFRGFDGSSIKRHSRYQTGLELQTDSSRVIRGRNLSDQSNSPQNGEEKAHAYAKGIYHSLTAHEGSWATVRP
jgi:hypothetical protein